MAGFTRSLTKDDPALVEAKFVYGNVLIGLALLQDHLKNPSVEQAEDWSIEFHVMNTTKAVAPFIVPMIDYLGSLEAEDVVAGAETDDSE